jgi:hypothetical protein
VTPLAATLDVAVALGAALVAALWLLRRGVRAWRGQASACGCGDAQPKGCSAAEGMARDLRAAAARGAKRAGASVPGGEPPAKGPR